MWFPFVSIALFVSIPRVCQDLSLTLRIGVFFVVRKSLLEDHLCELVGFSQCWLLCCFELQHVVKR